MTLAVPEIVRAGELFRRDWEVVVGDLAITGLRVGFTIDKTLAKEPNTAEIAIYNLAQGTRERLHVADGMPVLLRAGYKGTSLITLFLGEMREAFSKPEDSGEWITVLRAGDGDKILKKKRGPSGWRPGSSIERVATELMRKSGVGIGAGTKAMLDGIKSGNISPEGIGNAFATGFSGTGAFAQQFDKLFGAVEHEWSIQDGELQAMPNGQALALRGLTAVVLSRVSGLEGTPSITAKGLLTCRTRLQGGLMPGYPIEVQSAALGGRRDPKHRQHDIAGIWRVDKARFVGDTHGQDWNAELECTEVIV